MNAMTHFIEYWDRKVSKFGIVEVKMAQGVAMGFALILAKLIPSLMEISVWWFVGLLLLCGIRPIYVLFLKPDE